MIAVFEMANRLSAIVQCTYFYFITVEGFKDIGLCMWLWFVNVRLLFWRCLKYSLWFTVQLWPIDSMYVVISHYGASLNCAVQSVICSLQLVVLFIFS